MKSFTSILYKVIIFIGTYLDFILFRFNTIIKNNSINITILEFLLPPCFYLHTIKISIIKQGDPYVIRFYRFRINQIYLHSHENSLPNYFPRISIDGIKIRYRMAFIISNFLCKSPAWLPQRC